MKSYETSIPKWSKSRGDYSTPTTTPELLYKFMLYGHEETRKNPLVLFAIGGTPGDNYESNFDIYASSNGTLYSIARPGSGCQGTFFGDPDHVKRLIKQGHFSSTLTTYGKKLLKGENAA